MLLAFPIQYWQYLIWHPLELLALYASRDVKLKQLEADYLEMKRDAIGWCNTNP